MIKKVLSYNIHKGFCIRGRNYILDEIKESIKLQNPDFVLLQEVVGLHTHYKFTNSVSHKVDYVDQVAFLSDGLFPHAIYGGNKFHSFGHHGNAILSKYPILDWGNIDLSTNPFENRGLLWAKIQIDEFYPPITVLNTHLNLFEKSRKKQAGQIVETLKKLDSGDGIILAGDFNDWRNKMLSYLSEEIKIDDAYYKFHKKYNYTFPSFSPRLSLDRIYYKDLNIVKVESLDDGHWRSLSDHLPMYLEFQVV
jgi:endonuclease/exonuclease/phosphatase family metal-dependent hydrolase